MSHPTYKTLINYIEKQLSQAERGKVEEHLSGPCLQCSQKLTRLQTALEAAAQDQTVAPPADVLRRAVAIHHKRPKSAMASRGAARTRQMLFTTEQVDIDLQMTPDGSDHNLAGQVLGTELADKLSWAFVSLQNETGDLMKSTETDPLGQFIFKQIPPGVYDLVFDLGSHDITIAGLELNND
jgi:hypothetical protein